MEAIARGWKRDHGGNVLMRADLDEGYEDAAAVDVYSAGKTYARRRSSGTVEVLIGPNQLNLGGKYQVVVSFTQADLLRVFAEAFKDADFADVIARLARALKGARLL